MEIAKSALIDLVYNNVGNHIDRLKREYKLSNDDMETVLLKVMQDVKSARLIEAADNVLKLTQKINELEKEETNDNSDTGT